MYTAVVLQKHVLSLVLVLLSISIHLNLLRDNYCLRSFIERVICKIKLLLNMSKYTMSMLSDTTVYFIQYLQYTIQYFKPVWEKHAKPVVQWGIIQVTQIKVFDSTIPLSLVVE